jgi:hypothetical protein
MDDVRWCAVLMLVAWVAVCWASVLDGPLRVLAAGVFVVALAAAALRWVWCGGLAAWREDADA